MSFTEYPLKHQFFEIYLKYMFILYGLDFELFVV